MTLDSMNRSPADRAIEVTGLKKYFGDTHAVDGVDLTVNKGMVYGFLGPNGAGKTTTIRILATLLRPDEGHVRILGYDLAREAAEIKKRISLTGQFASIDEDLTGLENLIMIGRLTGFTRRSARERAEELLHAFGLEDAARRQVKKYSGGMRRRIDIAASIVITPELLFLDEPTAGLDPRSRNQVWDIVRALVEAGTTVLLTTQHLDEADQLSDRIAVIDHGKIIADGTSGSLKASVGTGSLHIRLADPADRDPVERLMTGLRIQSVSGSSDPMALSARVSDPLIAVGIMQKLAEAKIHVTDFSLGQPSLDEVFLTLTGQPADPETGKETSP